MAYNGAVHPYAEPARWEADPKWHPARREAFLAYRNMPDRSIRADAQAFPSRAARRLHRRLLLAWLPRPRPLAEGEHALLGPKLERNAERDRRVTAGLERDGWRVLRIWEHVRPERAAEAIAAALRGTGTHLQPAIRGEVALGCRPALLVQRCALWIYLG